MLVCKEAARLISESYQRPLRWGERVALRVHLMMCDACTNFKEQVRLMHEAARRLTEMQGREPAALHLSDDARIRIGEALAKKPPEGPG